MPATTACRPASSANGAALSADESSLAAGHLHQVCEAWAVWCRTRRLYTAPSLPPSILGRLASKSAPSSGTGPDAVCSAELAAFHAAWLAQNMHALDAQCFWLHYGARVANVKAAAAAMGISRQHWYRLVADCRARVYRISRDILAINCAAAESLPSRQMQTPAHRA
jgi:hypothetical protein